MKAILAISMMCLAVAPVAFGQADKDQAMHGIYSAADLKWKDGPPSLPPGAKVEMLEGDLTKEGPFTLRALLPDGYKIPPHTHPKIEHVTVISGTFYLG